jgi:hypothetical protein
MKLLLASLALAAGLSVGKNDQPALRLRGGLAGVDGAQVAKYAGMLLLANGAYCNLAPEPACKAYGMEKPSYDIMQMVKSLGAVNLASGVLALCVLNGVDTNQAIGWASLPWLVLTLDSIFNGAGEKMGQPAFAQPLLLAITSATMYCAFTNTNMPLAATLNSAWCLLNGLGAALTPTALASAWGMKGDAAFEGMLKNFGYQLAGYGVVQYFIANGGDSVKALGYGWVAALLSMIDMNFITKSVDALGVKKEALMGWGVIQAGVVATTVF